MRVTRTSWVLSALGGVVMLFLISGPSSAGFLGPAEPYAKPGSFTFNGGYSFVEQKVKSSEVDDLILKSNQYFVEGSYSPAKNWEFYLRAGGADQKVQSSDFKDGVRPFAGIGVRGLFYDNGLFGFGPFAQGNYYDTWKDSGFKITNAWDVTAGIAAQFKHSSGFIVYGGPYVYFTEMKLDNSDSTTLHQKDEIGGFVGLKWPVTKQVSVSGEASYAGRWSFGGFISYAF